jgi:hypothetical protein
MITPPMISTPYHRTLKGPIWKITGFIRFNLPLFSLLKSDSPKKSRGNLTTYRVFSIHGEDLTRTMGSLRVYCIHGLSILRVTSGCFTMAMYGYVMGFRIVH